MKSPKYYFHIGREKAIGYILDSDRTWTRRMLIMEKVNETGGNWIHLQENLW